MAGYNESIEYNDEGDFDVRCRIRANVAMIAPEDVQPCGKEMSPSLLDEYDVYHVSGQDACGKEPCAGAPAEDNN